MLHYWLNMKHQKAILWDLDGTILPSKQIVYEVLHEIWPEFGLEPPKIEAISSSFGMPLAEFLLENSFNHPEQEKITERFLESQLKHYHEISFFDGIIDTITKLNKIGFKQAVVTSKGTKGRGKAGAKNIIKNSALAGLIDIVVCSDDITNHKPHAEPLLLALSNLNVAPERAVMVGDQPVDMQTAKNANTYAVGLDHEKSHDNSMELLVAGADEVISSPQSVVPLALKFVG